MKKVAATIVALIALAVASPASAEYLPDGEKQRDVVSSKDMLVKYLGGNGFVLSRLELREYSQDPVADLTEIATKKSQAKVVRARAIQCLALYRSDQRVGKTLEAMLDKTRKSNPLFSAVLVAYAQVKGEQGAEKVAEHLDARDVDIRMAAVVSLGRFGGRMGFEMLQKRQDNEENERVRARISSYVR